MATWKILRGEGGCSPPPPPRPRMPMAAAALRVDKNIEIGNSLIQEGLGWAVEPPIKFYVFVFVFFPFLFFLFYSYVLYHTYLLIQ